MVTFYTNGQTRTAAWETNVALNYSLNEWQLNTSVSHRTVREKGESSSGNRMAFAEINQFVTRKINPSITGSFGYKYRVLNPTRSTNSYEHRLTQQFIYVHLNQRLRLLSRIRTEQRFFEDFFSHRYRYRLSLDMPLSGLKLDAREFYFLASNEMLLEVEDSTHLFDNRISVGLGYVVSNLYKLQLDITQRIENLNKEAEYVPFVHTSVIFNL